MNQLNEQRLELHVPIVAWLMILGHAFFLIGAAFVLAVLPGIGLAAGDRTAFTVLGIIASAVALLLAAFGLPGIAVGLGLLARKAWARVLAIVIAALGLVNFPVGTLVGVYAIWVLLQDAGGGYFSRRPGAVRAEVAAPA
jgi:hypothetical protein